MMKPVRKHYKPFRSRNTTFASRPPTRSESPPFVAYRKRETLNRSPDVDSVSPGVEKLKFLAHRENKPDVATLFAACSDGFIRVWSVSRAGGMRGEFHAANTQGEMLLDLAFTDDEELMITADSEGYLRVWDISHYCNGDDNLCSPELDAARETTWILYPWVRYQRKVRKIKELPKVKNLQP